MTAYSTPIESMKYIALLLCCVTPVISCWGQARSTPKKLTNEEIQAVFPEKVKEGMNITFSIFQCREYSDASGKYYLLLTEHNYKKEGSKVLNDSIRGYNIKKENTIMSIQWSLRDFINSEETTMWFWTKYLSLDDFDGDGLVEPIIVYGSANENDSDEGRIKILIYYKGVKTAIRHQNASLDGMRYSQVDKSFYELPSDVQTQVKKIMNRIAENGHAIFPYGWEEGMENRQLMLTESY